MYITPIGTKSYICEHQHFKWQEVLKNNSSIKLCNWSENNLYLIKIKILKIKKKNVNKSNKIKIIN